MSSKKYRERLKKDPIAHAEYKRKKAERAKELREKRRHDPIALAEYKQKDKERELIVYRMM